MWGEVPLRQLSAVGNHENPVSGNQPGTMSQQTSGAYLLYKVEPCLTATLVIQSPCYYGHFSLACQNGHIFSNQKPLLIQSPLMCPTATF